MTRFSVTIHSNTYFYFQVADLEDEISDLKSQLKSAQEQKYEACRGLEAEWRLKEAALEGRAEEAEGRAERAEGRLKETEEELERGERIDSCSSVVVIFFCFVLRVPMQAFVYKKIFLLQLKYVLGMITFLLLRFQ